MSAADHAAFLSAGTLLRNAKQFANATVASADAAYRDACERGYREGMDLAHAAATQENVQHSLALRTTLYGIEQDLSKLVVFTLRRMLGATDVTEQVALLVRQSLEQLGDLRGEIVIRCHPQHTIEIARRLASWKLHYPEAKFTSRADFDIAIDACHVICSNGHIVASLERQLQAIETALANGNDHAVRDGGVDASGNDGGARNSGIDSGRKDNGHESRNV